MSEEHRGTDRVTFSRGYDVCIMAIDGTWRSDEEFAITMEGDGTPGLWVQGTGDAEQGSAYGGMLFVRPTKQGTINVPASQDPKRSRITPGQPDASYLLCKVDPACSPILGARMPLGVPLTAQEIALLRAWISQGASGGGPVPDGGVPSDFAVPADQTPPVFAGATRAVSAPNSVTLSWGAATDDRSAAANLTYLIYQATSAGGETYATPTYTTAPGATGFAVGKLAINTTYYFVVRARDAAGNVDGNTVERSAKTGGVSLSGQVQPIFLAKCATNACHSGARPAQGLALGSAAATYAGTVNVASTECAANKLVLPNQPDQSYLIWKLQGSGPCFMGSQMPKGQPLTTAEITTVRSWILSGAPNN